MAVTETRVKITLTDAMSGPLKNIHSQLISTNSAAASLRKTFSSYAAIGASMAAGATGIYSVTDKLGEILGSGASFAKNMETNSIGMAGILSSMTVLNGETLQWNDALKISQGIISNLNQEALRTAATSEELVSTFRALLGPGLGAGMSVDEIQKFTVVGVNAVKSLGLNNVQLVQELRDLVQGGIQPASSTLATALGLKDSDIKAAKNSADGLYKFLMERLAGFKQAAAATPETLAGMQDQLKEGLTRALAIGFEPVLHEYKTILNSLNNMVIDPKTFEISPEFTNNLKAGADHVVNMWHGFENIAGVISPVIVPAAGKLAEGLALAADNVDKIAKGFAAWKVVDIARDIVRIKTATQGAYEAQTMFGQALQKVGGFWNTYAAQGQQAYLKEMQAAESAAMSVMQAESRKQAALRQYQTSVSASNKLISKGQADLGIQLLLTKQHYQKLGLSAEAAGRLQYQAAKQVAKGNAELTAEILRVQEAHIKAANAAQKFYARLNTAEKVAGGLGTTLTTVGGTLSLVTDETDGWLNSIATTAFKVGIAIEAIGLLIKQLGYLKEAYDAAAKAGTVAGLLKLAAGGAVGIGLAVGAATVGVYGATHDLSFDDMWQRWTYSKADYDKEANEKAAAFAEGLEKIERQRRQQQEIEEAAKLAMGLSTKYEETEQSDKAAERAVAKAQRRYSKSLDEMKELSAELDRKIIESTGSYYDIEIAKLTEDIAKMQSTVREAVDNGVGQDITNAINEKIAEYQAAKKKSIDIESTVRAHQLEMDYIAAREEAMQLSAQRADELRVQQLLQYKEDLNEKLSDLSLTLEQRLELQQEYAAAETALQEAQASDWQASWDAALEHLKNTQYDQLATLESGWDGITDTITNFGQNMLTDQKSWTERVNDLYTDLANNILNTMTKVIMQGLVMNSIMGLFGINTGSVFGTSANGIDYQKFVDGTIVSTVPSSQLKGISRNAKGGYAVGWSLVGEEGPELVNFSHPARVYTASQTAKALAQSGGENVQNVKVVLENHTGQQMEASAANVSFDPEGMIISIVLNAIRTNKNGMADIMRSMSAQPY